MRIIHINTSYERGGAAKVVRLLHDGLRKKGIDSIIISGREKKNISNEIVTFNIPTIIYYIDVMFFRLTGIDALISRFFIKRKLMKLDPDDTTVFHLHNLHGYYFPLNLVSWINQFKCVWTLHDYWLLTRRCAFPGDCTGYFDNCDNCENRYKYPAVVFDVWDELNLKKRIVREYRGAFISPSRYSRERAAQMNPEIKGKTRIINNSISPLFVYKDKNECKKEMNIPPERAVFSFVANILDDVNKNFLMFIEIFKTLFSNIPFSLIVCGKARNKNTIRFLDQNRDYVIHFDYISDEEMLSVVYSASDIHINCSQAETFGLTIIEAQACGSPVVVSPIEVYRETVIFPSEIVPDFSVDCYIQVILYVLEHTDADRMKLSSVVREKYSQDSMVDKYINIYKEILGFHA